MNALTQNSSKMSDALKARKAHLTTLLNVIDIKQGKTTETQKLTINAIKAEIGYIELRLKSQH